MNIDLPIVDRNTPEVSPAKSKWRPRWVHAVRIAVLISIVFAIHHQHQRFLRLRPSQAAIPLTLIQKHMPSADSMIVTDAFQGGLAILDPSGNTIAYACQTSPAADSIIGFSGPTNLLILCDSTMKISHVEILDSRDTRDHVEQIQNTPRFLQSFEGIDFRKPVTGHVDAVTGATLTSYAIAESIAKRAGATSASLKFSELPTLVAVQLLFPQAVSFTTDPGDPSQLRVFNDQSELIGWILRTSPVSDNIVGYQGPSDVLIGFSRLNKIIGITIGKSYDNEPYVTYVRDDDYFRTLFNDKNADELAVYDSSPSNVEGVSGATMTSLAVAKSIVARVQDHIDKSRKDYRTNQQPAAKSPSYLHRLIQPLIPQSVHDAIASVLVVVAVTVSASRLRSNRKLRFVMQLAMIIYLGFYAGTVLSMASFFGWSQAGLPRGAAPLVLLTIAAFALPIFAKRNVYCSHICPHGALQQLALRFAKPKLSVPKRMRWFQLLPGLTCLIAIGIVLSHAPFSLIDLEPFDAYVIRIAGWATITIAIFSFFVSCFIPMAYCRYGCATGAIIEYTRFHSKSDSLNRGDILAIVALIGACLL